jgi:hypothetical protein
LRFGPFAPDARVFEVFRAQERVDAVAREISGRDLHRRDRHGNFDEGGMAASA